MARSNVRSMVRIEQAFVCHSRGFESLFDSNGLRTSYEAVRSRVSIRTGRSIVRIEPSNGPSNPPLNSDVRKCMRTGLTLIVANALLWRAHISLAMRCGMPIVGKRAVACPYTISQKPDS